MKVCSVIMILATLVTQAGPPDLGGRDGKKTVSHGVTKPAEPNRAEAQCANPKLGDKVLWEKSEQATAKLLVNALALSSKYSELDHQLDSKAGPVYEALSRKYSNWERAQNITSTTGAWLAFIGFTLMISQVALGSSLDFRRPNFHKSPAGRLNGSLVTAGLISVVFGLTSWSMGNKFKTLEPEQVEALKVQLNHAFLSEAELLASMLNWDHSQKEKFLDGLNDVVIYKIGLGWGHTDRYTYDLMQPKALFTGGVKLPFNPEQTQPRLPEFSYEDIIDVIKKENLASKDQLTALDTLHKAGTFLSSLKTDKMDRKDINGWVERHCPVGDEFQANRNAMLKINAMLMDVLENPDANKPALTAQAKVETKKLVDETKNAIEALDLLKELNANNEKVNRLRGIIEK